MEMKKLFVYLLLLMSTGLLTACNDEKSVQEELAKKQLAQMELKEKYAKYNSCYNKKAVNLELPPGCQEIIDEWQKEHPPKKLIN